MKVTPHNLRRLKKRTGATHEEMAKSFEVTPRSWFRWLDGTRAPTGERKRAVEAALDLLRPAQK